MSSLLKPHCVAALAFAVMYLPALSPAAGGPATGSPLSVLSAFEQAWSEGRVDLVEKTLAADKITMSLSHAGPQDEAYTRTQAAYLIKDALAYRVTESFEFVEFHWSEGGSAMPSGTARWEFRRSEGEPLRELLLRVTLRQEGPSWVVAEIRVLPSR